MNPEIILKIDNNPRNYSILTNKRQIFFSCHAEMWGKIKEIKRAAKHYKNNQLELIF